MKSGGVITVMVALICIVWFSIKSSNKHQQNILSVLYVTVCYVWYSKLRTSNETKFLYTPVPAKSVRRYLNLANT